MRWHFQLSAPADGAYNMALDEALMRRAARTGDAVFRVYGWSLPTLSFGRNQRARGCYDEAAARRLGVGFVRRPTGGRVLLHHHEVTYSATMALPDADGAIAANAAYDFISEVLLGALARIGVNAERATMTMAVPPGPRPCFDVPAMREIVVDGRKLVGSAQWRHGGALLQHGSILVRDDQAQITTIAREEMDAPPAAATLFDALGREPEPAELARPLMESLESIVGSRVSPLRENGDWEHDLEQLRVTYAEEAWTWRR